MTIQEKIEALERETLVMSSVPQMQATQEYLSLKRDGMKAVGPLLEALPKTRAPWGMFALLREITDEDPVAPGVERSVDRTIGAWRAWGKAAGFIQ